MSDKNIRWKQRFSNFEKAYFFLEKAVAQNSYTELESAGLQQAFEFTFELAWKTLKDFLEAMGVIKNFPREVIKEAFASQIIQEGYVWIEMLEKRNELSHTYDLFTANKASQQIRNTFFPAIQQLYLTLQTKKND